MAHFKKKLKRFFTLLWSIFRANLAIIRYLRLSNARQWIQKQSGCEIHNKVVPLTETLNIFII